MFGPQPDQRTEKEKNENLLLSKFLFIAGNPLSLKGTKQFSIFSVISNYDFVTFGILKRVTLLHTIKHKQIVFRTSIELV